MDDLKLTTLEQLKNEFLTSEEIAEHNAFIEAEVKRIRGGKREGSGRKALVKGKVLKFTKRLTEEEAKFIDYARSHNINYEDLMQG